MRKLCYDLDQHIRRHAYPRFHHTFIISARCWQNTVGRWYNVKLRIYCYVCAAAFDPPFFALGTVAVVVARLWLWKRVRRGPEPHLAAVHAQGLNQPRACLLQVPSGLRIAPAEQRERLLLLVRQREQVQGKRVTPRRRVVASVATRTAAAAGTGR